MTSFLTLSIIGAIGAIWPQATPSLGSVPCASLCDVRGKGPASRERGEDKSRQSRLLSYEIRQDGIAAVGDVVAGKSADLVLLNSGYNGNFCTGASCVVERNGVPVAELVIAKAVEDCSVALITSIGDEQTLQVGDVVKLKMITF